MGNKRRAKGKPEALQQFKGDSGNSVVINDGWRSVALRHKDGSPFTAGELVPGQEIRFNPVTGIVNNVRPRKAKVPTKVVYDLSVVSDAQLLEEMKKRGVKTLTF